MHKVTLFGFGLQLWLIGLVTVVMLNGLFVGLKNRSGA